MARNTGKWAAGALAAGVIGYAAGILTAPKSGKETRADIKHAVSKAKAEAEKKLKVLHSELGQYIGKAKDKASNLTGKAKTDLNKVIENAAKTKERVRELLSALHDGDASDPELNKAMRDAKDALKRLKDYVKT
jgi:gas vesicle protein